MAWADLTCFDSDEGWWLRTVRFGDQVFSARCPECARFVKVDDEVKLRVDFAGVAEPNATCSKHGRVKTPFLAWWSDCAD